MSATSMPDKSTFHYEALTNGWTVGRFRALAELPGIVHAVTTRCGLDVDLVRRDHAAAADELAGALGMAEVAFVEQVHGAIVLEASQGGCLGEADGVVTSRTGLGLMTRGADCPLILAADPVAGVIGSAHASWRGTAARMAQQLIHRMTQDLHAAPERIVACICPSAGPCCYQVGAEVVETFTHAIGQHATEFFVDRADGIYLDLWAANRDQLLRSDLQERNIHVAGVCTICAGEFFPSHRREGAAAGRFVAAIGRMPT